MQFVKWYCNSVVVSKAKERAALLIDFIGYVILVGTLPLVIGIILYAWMFLLYEPMRGNVGNFNAWFICWGIPMLIIVAQKIYKLFVHLKMSYTQWSKTL